MLYYSPTLDLMMLKTAEPNRSRPILFISEIVCVHYIICTYWLRLIGYVTVMTPMHYGDDHYYTCYVFFYMEDKRVENIIFKALYRNG